MTPNVLYAVPTAPSRFTFHPVLVGTYLRPTVTFHEPVLDVDALVEAYVIWCEQHAMKSDWTFDTHDLDIGHWALLSLDAHGRRQPFELCPTTRFENLHLSDEIVRLHFVIRDPIHQGRATYSRAPLVHTPHLRGVIELINPFDAEILVATFNALGLSDYGRISGTAHGQPTFSTTFDIVIHPEAIPDPTKMAVNLSTTGSMTMRMDADFAFTAVEDLISQHITDLTIMNSTDSNITADISSVTAATPVDAAVIPTLDLSTAVSADHPNTLAAMDSTPIEVTAHSPIEVTADNVSLTASSDIELASADTAVTEVTAASAQSDVVDISTAAAETESAGERTIDTPQVDVSRLLSSGLNGAGARPERQRKDKGDKHGKKAPANDRQFGANKRPAPERAPTPAPGPTALANAFARNASALEALKSFVQATSRGMEPENDGVDHVNVTNSGRTELGQKLEIFARTPFSVPGLGTFESIAALWCYLMAKPSDRERFRGIQGSVARLRLNEIETAPGAKRPKGFMLILADALWAKITTSPELVELVTANKLRFEMYHVYEAGGVPTRMKMSYWYCMMLKEIQRTLKAIKTTGDLSLAPDFEAIAKIEDDFAMPQPYRSDKRPARSEGNSERREATRGQGPRGPASNSGNAHPQGQRPARQAA